MKIEQKKVERGEVELTIELSPEEYQPFLQNAAEQISKEKNIAGFRPGKASLGIVIQQVGAQAVWQQALEPAIQKTFTKAIEQEKLLTIGSPQIDVVKLAPDNPVIYKATIALLPSLELADYSKIKIKAKPVEVAEDEIKKTLNNLQKSRAKESAVDRASKTGDKVEIDFETFLDKIPVDKGKQEKFPLTIGEKTFIPGFEEKITGLKKGDTKEFQLKFPETYHQKNLAGRLVDFKIKVNEVYQLDLPELNDEFAKSLDGEFKTFKDLETRIKHDMTYQKEHKAQHELEEEMIDKVITQSIFGDIPNLLVDSETKKMIQELEQNITAQGLQFDDYLMHLNKKREDLLLEFAPQAIKRVKSALIMREVAKVEKIDADEKEIEEEIQKMLAAYASNPEIAKQIDTPQYRDYTRNVLAAKKVMDHIKSAMVDKK